jgi:OPA family glycerol-3-phosphate transporter-like MFS transporter
VAATCWRTWLVISLVCLLLFAPAVFLFGGPWRRSPASDRVTPDAEPV